MPLLMNYLSNQHAITLFAHLFDQSACYYSFTHLFNQSVCYDSFLHCLWLQVNNAIQD